VLTCDIPVNEIIINGDEEKLGLVFEGLINNAIKFTDSGGRIIVSAQSLYKEFEIIISDTGTGIPENDLPNIFDKFYRVRRPGKEIPGTGLGLVFVKQIVDLHKGLITVNSEVNMGTSFVIKLPKGIKF
jgi:two-component system phosphate regulon sensor histidine kinase PhoR